MISAGFLLVAAGCGGAGGEKPLASPNEFAKASEGNIAETSAVQVKTRGFNPAAAKVPAGTTVTWTNGDPEGHTVVAGERPRGVGDEPAPPPVPFEGDMKALGDTFEFTFSEPGDYLYYCRIHATMDGRVIVQ